MSEARSIILYSLESRLQPSDPDKEAKTSYLQTSPIPLLYPLLRMQKACVPLVSTNATLRETFCCLGPKLESLKELMLCLSSTELKLFVSPNYDI